MNLPMKREICDCCKKNILIGQRFLECQKCPKLIHKNCFKKSNFVQGGTGHVCVNCSIIYPVKYNPFTELSSKLYEKDSEGKFYSDDFMESFDCIGQASKILDKCMNYKFKAIHEQVPKETDFGTLFYNIDGNLSNFDSFSAELASQKFTYSAIALAETNVGKDKGTCTGLTFILIFIMKKSETNLKVQVSAYTFIAPSMLLLTKSSVVPLIIWSHFSFPST